MSLDGPLSFNETQELESLNSKQTNIYKVQVPYNIKMMSQECEAMGISMRFIVNNTPMKKSIGSQIKCYFLRKING